MQKRRSLHLLTPSRRDATGMLNAKYHKTTTPLRACTISVIWVRRVDKQIPEMLVLALEIVDVLLQQLHAFRGAHDDFLRDFGEAPQAQDDNEGADALGEASRTDVNGEAEDDDGRVEEVEPGAEVAVCLTDSLVSGNGIYQG